MFNSSSTIYYDASFIPLNDGNYTLDINPLTVGTFYIVLNFDRYGYINQTVILTLIISETPTQLFNSSEGAWSDTTYDRDFHQYNKDDITVLFQFNDTFYGDTGTLQKGGK